MPTEIEAKIKVEQLEVICRRLEQLEAQYQQEVVQRDYFFDRPDGSLRASDCGLRLRQERQQDTTKSITCFKGPRIRESRYKQREEIEFVVSDPTGARELLEALGHEVILAFEKQRSVWRLNDCTVCLDKVVEIGNFVEIEGASEAAISKVQAQLGLAESQIILEGYAVMLAEHLRETGQKPPHELFF